jgi:alkylated DNA repair protein alkB family protein 1
MYEAQQKDHPQTGVHQFREAEKAVQRRLRTRGKTRGKLLEEVVDLSSVIDFEKLMFVGEGDAQGGDNVSGVHQTQRWGAIRRTRQRASGNILVYSFERHPGFYVVRHAMDDMVASKMAEECFGDNVLRPPATTNFNKSHGLWMSKLWDAASKDLSLVSDSDDTLQKSENITHTTGTTTTVTEWAANGTGPPAKEFLASLRWASIGPCYDWTNRIYLKDEEHVRLPEDMKAFAKLIWATVNRHECRETVSDYAPNAALINYYREGDKLCGHTDDAELDQTQPLVSISLGCPAVFLMGGKDKDVVPTPMILRHGDVAVLSGDARRAFHGTHGIVCHPSPAQSLSLPVVHPPGLPRIFPANRKHKLVDADGSIINYNADTNPADLPQCVLYARERGMATAPTTPVATYLLDCRVNISIRQV